MSKRKRLSKPHLRLTPAGWLCEARGLRGISRTPAGAYSEWYRRYRLVRIYGVDEAKRQWSLRTPGWYSQQTWDGLSGVMQ